MPVMVRLSVNMRYDVLCLTIKERMIDMAVLLSVVSYVVIGIALVAVALGGLFIGMALRKNKDSKKKQETAE